MDKRTNLEVILFVEVIFDIEVFQSDLAISEAYINLCAPFAIFHLHSEAGVGNGETILEE